MAAVSLPLLAVCWLLVSLSPAPVSLQPDAVTLHLPEPASALLDAVVLCLSVVLINYILSSQNFSPRADYIYAYIYAYIHLYIE